MFSEEISKNKILLESKYIKYPPIPDLCLCGCGTIVYKGKKYIHGHNGRKTTLSEREKLNLKLLNTKLFLLHPDGSKEIYPPIPDLCHCGCRTIVYGGKRYVNEHKSRGRKASPETIQKLIDSHTGIISPIKGIPKSEESIIKMKEKLKKGYENGTYKIWCKGLKLTSEHIENLHKSHLGQIPSPKSGIGGIERIHIYKSPFQGEVKLRFSYEPLYASYLDSKNILWYYEYKTFYIIMNSGKDTTYTPDFYLPETDEYIEIKGYWRDNSKEKFEAFKIQYPNIKIQLLMKKDLEQLGIKIKK